MDAGQAGGHAGLDLIVSSMTLHWLADPVASLERLRRFLAPDGLLLYAALGPESFAEWRAVLASEGLPSGLADIPPLPGVVDEERLTPRCGHAILPPSHAGGRRNYAARRLRPASSRRAPPRNPRHRRPFRRPHHLAYRLWRAWRPGGERIEAFGDAGIGAGQLLVGDAIGRHEINRLPDRSDVEAVSEIPVA